MEDQAQPTEPVARLLQRAEDDLAGARDASAAAARLAGDAMAAMAAFDPTTTASLAARRCGLLDTAAALARAVHADDRDDLHWPSLTHPGSVVWPSALAASTADTPLPVLLAAGALGYQVTARAAELLGREHRACFHATSTAGALGATAAACHVLSLDRGQRQAALRHAASTLGGTAQAVREGSATGAFHRIVGATTAVAAARAADLAPSVARPLDGPSGFSAATGVALAEHADELDVAVTATTLRRHLVSGFAHTLVDALLDLPRLDPATIRRVVAQVPPMAIAATEPVQQERPRRAAWHLPHIVASALIEPVAPLRALPIDDAVTASLRRRVEVVPRPGADDDLSVAVRIDRRGAAPLVHTRDHPCGHPLDPLDLDELVTKAVQRGLPEPACVRLFDDLLAGAGTVGALPLASLTGQDAAAATCGEAAR